MVGALLFVAAIGTQSTVAVATWEEAARAQAKAAVTWEAVADDCQTRGEVVAARLAAAEAEIESAAAAANARELEQDEEEARLNASLIQAAAEAEGRVSASSRVLVAAGAFVCGAGLASAVAGAALCDGPDCQKTLLIGGGAAVVVGCTVWAAVELLD